MKYEIEYSPAKRAGNRTECYSTDDPVACESFLEELLEKEARIHRISHLGQDLDQHDFDQMIRTAVGMMAAHHVCKSLDVDSVEAHYRFGVPAA